jgi:hypothetical protein
MKMKINERKRGGVNVEKDKLACHPLEGFLG